MWSSQIVTGYPIPLAMILGPGGGLSIPIGIDTICQLLAELQLLNYNRYRSHSPLQLILFVYT